MESFDIAVIGAGAAGMMCAAVAAQSGRRVVLIDHAERLAEKIRISGGGRCNFTNINAGPANFLSANPHFCRSALARYTPRDFLALLKQYRVSWHEKHKGQLFCDDSSESIIELLKSECDAGRVAWRHPVTVDAIRRDGERFALDTAAGTIEAAALVIATGGLSIPKIGATDFGYRVAKQFGHKLVDMRPALVPLTFAADDWAPFSALSGLSVEVDLSTGKGKTRGEFSEDLLLTHRGLSGPGVLQISSYWNPSEPIHIDLLPGIDATEALLEAKAGSKKQIATFLAEHVPVRLAHTWLEARGVPADARLADLPDRTLKAVGESLSRWTLTPNGTEGYRKAEVTRGGVDTRELSSATMMSARTPGLYFVGEAVDVTGWLGGYNFQWAWASGVAAGQAAAEFARERALRDSA
ncbi:MULTISPECIES: NAD(P)/FAD-dependent oxidoreductase [unclassified Caballeronia]|uniref:NAD(P)/FAD-dependent oxidoreductase n=1 Tax=unclassified Caballeronia TaxID=2646786 RepID=UPI0028567CC5|nr:MULTISPECIES: NAD(P)/FAD-dependent oxidoreductase [unclassified Caballeronia]MDR5754780.1 NAD(P)/FAD-dependent oxidoreductase [Caballeronia sp. LZ024]MDR5839719.1 NAD(P)/FAD-dependent oxidoreductase [Caballeronia sp. LZ031]